MAHMNIQARRLSLDNIWGKENLTDAAWHFPTNAADGFFKVSARGACESGIIGT